MIAECQSRAAGISRLNFASTIASVAVSYTAPFPRGTWVLSCAGTIEKVCRPNAPGTVTSPSRSISLNAAITHDAGLSHDEERDHSPVVEVSQELM